MRGYEAWSYGDAFADVYDDWYADVSDVVATTTVLAELALAAGGPVLELGVGSGRLAVPLANRGLTVWGLDASTAMLERLRARPGGDQVRAVVGDMADPAAALSAAPGAPSAFGLVACTFNTLFLLTSENAQQACLRAAAGLLAPGGAVVVEAIVPAEGLTGVERVLEPRTIEVDRVVLTVSHHDPARQQVTGQHIELRETGTRLRPWVLRYLYPAQLDALAAAAGLTLESRWASWDRRPFDAASTAHVSVYRRAGPVRADEGPVR